MREEVSLEENGLVMVMVDIDTSETARKMLGRMAECPHLVWMSAVKDNCQRAICLFVLPRDKVWWAMMLSERPQVISAESAIATVLEHPQPDRVTLNRAKSPDGSVPCGSDCVACPQYRIRCRGCPASRFHLVDFPLEA